MPEAKLWIKLANPPVMSSKNNSRFRAHSTRCTGRSVWAPLSVFRSPFALYRAPSLLSLTEKTGGHKMPSVKMRLP